MRRDATLSKYTNPSAALSNEIYAHKISIRETLTSPAKKKKLPPRL